MDNNVGLPEREGVLDGGDKGKLFLESGEGKEKERERNISVWLPLAHSLLGPWPATQACVLTGSRTRNPLVLRPALNPLSHTSRGNKI